MTDIGEVVADAHQTFVLFVLSRAQGVAIPQGGLRPAIPAWTLDEEGRCPMATVTEAAAHTGERGGRGDADGNGGPGRRRTRMGAALRARSWSVVSALLRLGVVTNAG